MRVMFIIVRSIGGLESNMKADELEQDIIDTYSEMMEE